jgi:hypothetical protein
MHVARENASNAISRLCAIRLDTSH